MSFESAIFNVLSRSVMPVKAAALQKAVKALVGRGFKKEFLMGALGGLVGAGRVHALALTAGKPGELSYSMAAPGEVAVEILRAKIQAAVRPIKQGELRKKLPAALQVYYEGAFRALIEGREIFVLPRSVPVILTRPPRPSDLVEGAKARVVGGVLQQANRLRERPVTLEDFLKWLDGEAEPGKAAGPGAGVAAAVAPDGSGEVLTPTVERLRVWYEEDRRRSSTRMIPIPLTWRRYAEWAVVERGRADVEVFKRLLQNLYNAGEVLLEPCERPQDLPVQEQSLLVPLALGPPGFAWSWASD